MVRYVKCPRCELNYIDEEKQEYCDVCLAELHGNKLQFADLDEEELEELDGELEQEELCPVCGVNTLRYGEKLCESCKQKASEYETEEDIDGEEEEEESFDDDFFDEDLESLTDLEDEEDYEDEDEDDDF